tara:strand:- start:1753 stop:2163 length:411 start_codon:yes stop_codon:yes gene_type:complete
MIEDMKNIRSSKKDLRNFGIIIGCLSLIISGFLYYQSIGFYIEIFNFGAIFIIFGVILPIILKPIYLLWMIFALIIGWVMTRLILSVLFFFVITTIGIFARLFGKDFLNLKSDNRDSFWNLRNRDHELNQDYEKQF